MSTPDTLGSGSLNSWFKAASITGVSDGAAISSWSDSGTLAHNLTTVNGTAPLWRATTAPGGNPCVDHNGVSGGLTGAAPMGQPAGDMTYFGMFKIPTPVVMTDTFTHADSATSMGTATSGQAWQTDGVYGISGNQGYHVSGFAAAAWIMGATPATFAEVDIVYPSTSTTESLITRLVDANNYLHAIITDTQILLYKKDSGSYTQLGSAVSATHTSGTTYRLRVAISGSTVTVYQDGVSKITYSLTSPEQAKFLASNAVGVGMRSSTTTARYDNLATNNDFHSLIFGGGTIGAAELAISTTGKVSLNASGSAVAAVSTLSVPLDTWTPIVLTYVVSTGATTYRIGTSSESVSGSSVTFTGTAVLEYAGYAGASNMYGMRGQTAEFGLYSSTLSSTDADALLAYLTAKYSTHPPVRRATIVASQAAQRASRW